MDPEKAHERMTTLLNLAQKIPGGPHFVSWSLGKPPAGLETEVLGMRFKNPIGLAAGFDKDGRLSRILPALGFGFLELGSITLEPQPGNPKPRIFRLPEENALINRLGFNSQGAVAVVSHLKTSASQELPVGINLGLNAGCPKEKASEQYAQTFRLLEPYGDYFAVNVSSPNTKGLRDLQEKSYLQKILSSLKAENKNSKPLLVKISPDLSDEQLFDVLEPISQSASGVIATNTTLSRGGLPGRCAEIAGGLSGAPLRLKSTVLIQKIYRMTQGKMPIIGVGGISSGQDAFEKIGAGACLVELYTGFIYRGPSAILRIAKELSALLSRHGLKTVSQAVGSQL